MYKYYCLLLLGSIALNCNTPVQGLKIELTRFEWLDRSQTVSVRWGFSGYESTDAITFEVTAKTLGWVGFGLSPNGGMKNADIVLGGVGPNGKPYLYDMHGNCNCQPEVDAHSDYQLEDARQNETHTVLKFTRKLHTCDPEDYAITTGTVRFIWAMHAEDAKSPTSFSKHEMANRGARSVFPLQKNDVLLDTPMPDDVITFDLVVDDVKIPDDFHTLYWCKVIELPKLGKHHMIKYTPITTPGNEPFLHHIVVYNCGNNLSTEVGRQEACFNRNVTEFSDLGKCRSSTFAVWAVGSDGVALPEMFGIPVLEEGSSPYLVIEVHYDNSAHLPTPILDNSGMRLYFTPTLRPVEYGQFTTGMGVSAEQLLIPPGQNKITLHAICDFQCTQKLPEGGITVASGFLHEHVAGSAVRLRHFRNGVELPPILSDEHYDFNYQDQMYLPEPVKIMPNDTLLTECDYFSTEKTDPIYGGFGTPQEMCFVFLNYYPKTAGIQYCLGGPQLGTYAAAMKTETHGDIGKVFTHPESKANISIKTFSKLVEWGKAAVGEERSEMGQYFQEQLIQGNYYEFCGGTVGKFEAKDETMMEMWEKDEVDAEKANQTESQPKVFDYSGSEEDFELNHPKIQDVKFDLHFDLKLELPETPYRPPSHCSAPDMEKVKQEDQNLVSLKRKSIFTRKQQEDDEKEEEDDDDDDEEEENGENASSKLATSLMLYLATFVATVWIN